MKKLVLEIMLVLVFVFALATRLHGQTLTFFEEGTKEGIENVYAKISSLASGQQLNRLSDINGQVALSGISFPAIIESQHPGFLSSRDTLKQQSDHIITLVPVTNQLDDFVVTGQFNPQSASNSVFQVKVINQEQIKVRNAVSLEEVLSNALNVRISQDLAIGSASISLLGVSGQNIKVLLDGVPLVNRNGNGNAADLSQINMSQIERIEIVEGPMAVNYGANALAGVINLITKKETTAKTEFSASIQEESAGSEYGLDKGRHIQTFAVNHQLPGPWYVQAGIQRNDFSGFIGNSLPRQFEWNPKRQWQSNALLGYKGGQNQVYYRLDYLNELISDFGVAQNNFLPGGENQPFAIDEEYHSQRFIHHVQFEGKIKGLNRYNGFISYSDFERDKSRFSKNLVTGAEHLTVNEGDQDLSTYRVLEAGGTVSKSLSNLATLQAGYQLTFEEVGGGRILTGKQSINNVAFYSSAEWTPWKSLTVRPGIRYVNNSAFGSQLVPSLQLKYDLKNQTLVRFAYGRGFRSPTVRELYFEFVDTNHRIFGNPNLSPEFSSYFSLNASRNYQVKNWSASTEVNTFFNDITDQIGLAQSPTDATAVSYINIDRFKTLGGTINQTFKSANTSFSIGASYIGRYNDLSGLEGNDLKRFFFTPELNANLSHSPGASVRINLFYKYTGRLQNYLVSEDDQGNQLVNTGRVEGFHWLDINASRSLGKSLELSLGIRNLANIRRINNSGAAGGAHSGGPNVPVSYGRSYFIKLNYNLKTND